MESCNGTSAEFRCDMCHEFLSSKRMLDRHMKLQHEKCDDGIYTCEICTKVFDNFFPYLQHKKRDHNELTYTCNRCNKQFGRKDVLQKHMKLFHENTNDEPVIGMLSAWL